MNDSPVATLDHAGWTASIYSCEVPGEFRVVYCDGEGRELEEAQVTGISSYHQRENEILQHLKDLQSGVVSAGTPDLGDAGEY